MNGVVAPSGDPVNTVECNPRVLAQYTKESETMPIGNKAAL